MPLWLGAPILKFGKPPAFDERFLFYYLNACTAFEVQPLPIQKCDSVGFRDDTESLAASAIRDALHEAGWSREAKGVRYILDCRSGPSLGSPAPTYKLQVQTALETAIPLSLSGHDGIEFAQACKLLQLLDNQEEWRGIVAASQSLTMDNWSTRDSYPMERASAAQCVIASSTSPGRAWLLLRGVELAHAPGYDWSRGILRCMHERWLKEHIQSAQWAIVHHYSKDFVSAVSSIFPSIRWLQRQGSAEVNFGCADTLATLTEIWGLHGALNGLGVIICASPTGGVAIIAVE